MKTRIIRNYTELARLPTFEERFQYLKLNGQVGRDTFGFDRVFNQRFYRSEEWKRIRNYIIVRDTGNQNACCDLGVPGYEIGERILIHHMNPITLDDITESSEFLLNPEYLIAVSHTTHNAIHYGGDAKIYSQPVNRHPNDTCPWKK